MIWLTEASLSKGKPWTPFFNGVTTFYRAIMLHFKGKHAVRGFE
jgi:hypothetical protein